MNRFYVYAYLRSKDSETAKAGTPYCIGKGTNKRMYEKHSVGIPPDRKNIVVLFDQLLEIGAFILERNLIKWYGRKDSVTGILKIEQTVVMELLVELYLKNRDRKVV